MRGSVLVLKASKFLLFLRTKNTIAAATIEMMSTEPTEIPAIATGPI